MIGVNSYQSSAQILIQANAPSGSTANGGRTYRMRASHDGYFYFIAEDVQSNLSITAFYQKAADGGAWAERSGTGLPVRCVRE